MNVFVPVLLALLAARTVEVVTLGAINYFRELHEYKKILRNEINRNKPTSIVTEQDEQ